MGCAPFSILLTFGEIVIVNAGRRAVKPGWPGDLVS